MQSCTHKLTQQHCQHSLSSLHHYRPLYCYCCLMSWWWTRVELLLVSATAAAPSHYTAWSPVSTILAPLCRGKAAVSFPAAPACSTTVCVPTAECVQCVPTLQHCSMTPPCSRAPVVVRRLRMRWPLHSTAAGPYCRAPWDTAATTVMLSPLDRVYRSPPF